MIFRLITLFILLISFTLSAGDAAQFCSIGWSQNYDYFAFAQFGEQDGSGFPYADLFVVDVAQNNFAKNGVHKRLWKDDVDTAATGLHALLLLYDEADSILKTYDISVTQQISPVFTNRENECISADWQAGDNHYSIALEQNALGDPGSFESSAAFHLLLKVNDNKPVIIGDKSRYRKYVMRYDIDHILQTPDKKSMVIVIRITKLGFEGPDSRYMVETIKLH